MHDLLTMRSITHSRSTLARASLFEKVAGLWLGDNAALNAESQDVMDRLLTDLIPDVEPFVKAKVATSLSQCGTAPARLVRALAHDHDISVAGPILERCKSLPENELLRLAQSGGVLTRLALARREALPLQLAEALCHRRELAVLRLVAANPGARLSRRVFRELTAQAKGDEALCETLLARSDFPADLAFKVFWWVSPPWRRAVVERFPVSAAQVDIAQHDLGDQPMDAAIAVKHESQDLSANVEGATSLLKALRNGGLRGAVKSLSAAAGIRADTAARIINDKDAEPMAIALCALGADGTQLRALVETLDHLRSGPVRTAASMASLEHVFHAVTQCRAQTILAIWNVQLRDRT